jgi:translation initiation factor IF-2
VNVAKVRVYELARDLGQDSKDVLERARELGIEVKTASSGLDEDSANLVRTSFVEAQGTPAATETNAEPVVAVPPKVAPIAEPTPASAAEADLEAEVEERSRSRTRSPLRNRWNPPNPQRTRRKCSSSNQASRCTNLHG